MKKHTGKWIFLALMMSVLLVTSALADELVTRERRITSSTAYETTPTVGNDGTTDLVVYTLRPVLGAGLLGAGDIWYQPLVGGAPSGAPVQVTSGASDDELNDVSGDFIVYTAYDSTTATSGAIIVYQISTGDLCTLGTATIIQEPKIHGNRVVWREGGALSAKVMYYELGWIPYGSSPRCLAGPIPPTYDVQIGDRFAVWAELDGSYNVHAYDFAMLTEVVVADTAADERQPATSGAWIVWQQDAGAASSIEALNMDSMERVSIANGGGNFNPTVDGDLVAWESDVAGNLDIWVHRFSVDESYAVTTDPADQYLNDVFGDLVAYVDMTSGSEDIYVSSLAFIPSDPCADLGGDTDGDGVCNANDNCPDVTNPDQADADGDSVGDVCDFEPGDPCADLGGDTDEDGMCNANDNCPDVTNPDQTDLDNDGVGDACDICPSTYNPDYQLGSRGDGSACDCDTQCSRGRCVNAITAIWYDSHQGACCPPGQYWNVNHCETCDDSDGDEVCDSLDNCPMVPNPVQEDTDEDGVGNVCDPVVNGCTSPLVAPSVLNFGDVTVGESATQIITVTNVDVPNISLAELAFSAGSSGDFQATASLPTTLANNATADISISYVPTAEGPAEGNLLIAWSCGTHNDEVPVTMSGVGVPAEVPPAQQIMNILVFMDEAVDSGSLVGDGPGNSASGRLEALRNMIEAAGDLIEAGEIEEACGQLEAAHKKCDGSLKPPDFVAGDAASTLAGMIKDLMDSLGCE